MKQSSNKKTQQFNHQYRNNSSPRQPKVATVGAAVTNQTQPATTNANSGAQTTREYRSNTNAQPQNQSSGSKQRQQMQSNSQKQIQYPKGQGQQQQQSANNQNEMETMTQGLNQDRQKARLLQQMQQQQQDHTLGQSQQPPPPASAQNTQQQPPPLPQFMMQQTHQAGVQLGNNPPNLLGAPGITQQDFLNQQLVNCAGVNPQQQFGALNLGNIPQLDPAGMQNLALGGMNTLNGMNGLNLSQVLPQQNQSPVDMQNLKNQGQQNMIKKNGPYGDQNLNFIMPDYNNTMGQQQQFGHSMGGTGGVVQQNFQNMQNQQFQQNFNNMNLNGTPNCPPQGNQDQNNMMNQQQNPYDMFQYGGDQQQQNQGQNSAGANGQYQPMMQQPQQLQPGVQGGAQGVVAHGGSKGGNGGMPQIQMPMHQGDPSDLMMNQNFHNNSFPGMINQGAAAGIPGAIAASASISTTFPIRVSLDFSDEKSQNLFIFEQKYNVKKNDCFNLEKQKMALTQQIANKDEQIEKLKKTIQEMQEKMRTQYDGSSPSQDQQNTAYNPAASVGNTQVLQTQLKKFEKTIADLEESHNEQLNMINHYKQMSEDKTKFSLEVINKSMLAVDLIRKYKNEGEKKVNEPSVQPTTNEVNEVEEKIIQCQEAIQKDLIPTDPSSMVNNPLSLKFLKNVQNSSGVGGSGGCNGCNHQRYPASKIFLPKYRHEHQASNILEMERRYEMPLKQPLLQAHRGQMIMQGNGVPMMHNNQVGSHQHMTHLQVQEQTTRHNFYEIQDTLHNEILLFKMDANAMMRELNVLKEKLIERLSNIITRVLPNYFVEVYGSHATGLCLHWSDIDLAVGTKNMEGDKNVPMQIIENKMKEALRRISESLKLEIPNQWIVNVNYLDHATVPVVKIECSLSTFAKSINHKYPVNPKYAQIYSQLFSIDITHMNDFNNGLKCVNLVKEYLLDCWFIEPIILVLKQMLKVNGLNVPFYGGLSSYGLFLLIVAFIQFRKLNQVRTPSNINLGNILLDFLHYYGEILQYQEYGIMCRTPGDMSESNIFYNIIPEINIMYNQSKVPCIDDPLNRQNNVGKTAYKFNEIQQVFKVGYQSAFLGCFCDCHFYNHKDCGKSPCTEEQTQQTTPINGGEQPQNNCQMQFSSRPYIQREGHQRWLPDYSQTTGDLQNPILYQDDMGLQNIDIETMYLYERLSSKVSCDSILTKIIYSQAQFKAAEENAIR